MRGQSAYEYFIIAGILLVIITPIFLYSLQNTEVSLRTTQVKSAVLTLSEAANRVFNSGGGKTFTTITLPSGVKGYKIENRTIRYTILFGNQTSDVIVTTLGNVTGNLPVQQGTYRIIVEMLPNRTILIQGLDTTPPVVIFTAPNGTIPENNAKLKAVTNENAQCRYCKSTECTENTAYSQMARNFSGSGTYHESVENLPNGPHLFYARCADTSGNAMIESATISFTIDPSAPDNEPPDVRNTATNKKFVVVKQKICVSANATDNVGVDDVWALVTDPNGNGASYNLLKGGCTGNYSANITLNVVGNYTINTSFANDSAGNLGEEIPRPNIIVEVISVEEAVCRELYPCKDLVDVGIDEGWYFKSNSGPFVDDNIDKDACKFTGASNNLSCQLLDDDIRTPPSSVIIKQSDPSYDMFIVHLNNESSKYSLLKLSGRVSLTTLDPFNLTIVGYNQNGISVDAQGAESFLVPASVLLQKVKWFDFDVTNISHRMDGYGFIRLRIFSSNTSSQAGRPFQFTEIHMKVAK